MISPSQILTFKNSADQIFANSDFTSATILYFKTIFAIYDYILLEKTGYAPKDHKERFRLLEKEFPEQYKTLDTEFNTYRNTYTRIISKDTCKRIKKIVENELLKHKIE